MPPKIAGREQNSQPLHLVGFKKIRCFSGGQVSLLEFAQIVSVIEYWGGICSEGVIRRIVLDKTVSNTAFYSFAESPQFLDDPRKLLRAFWT